MLPILTREDEQRVGSWEEAGKFYSVPGIRITLTTRQDLSRHCIDMNGLGACQHPGMIYRILAQDKVEEFRM